MITRSSVLDQLLEPVITPAVAARIVDLRTDEQTQARIDELADKCNEGELTADEQSEYEAYVSAINFVSVLQARARRVLNQKSP